MFESAGGSCEHEENRAGHRKRRMFQQPFRKRKVNHTDDEDEWKEPEVIDRSVPKLRVIPFKRITSVKEAKAQVDVDRVDHAPQQKRNIHTLESASDILS